MTTNRPLPEGRRLKDIARVKLRKYHDTALYTAVIATVILILQIYSLTRGN